MMYRNHAMRSTDQQMQIAENHNLNEETQQQQQQKSELELLLSPSVQCTITAFVRCPFTCKTRFSQTN